MNYINYIYWQHGRIGIFTNTLNTEKHSHWMLQLFLSLNGQLKIEVNEKEIKCKCIVVDKNIPHSIDADNKMAFSALIAPTSLSQEQFNHIRVLVGIGYVRWTVLHQFKKAP